MTTPGMTYALGCGVDGCTGPHHGHGYCIKHAHRFRKYGDPLKGTRLFDPADRLEDVRWMAETGEGLTGAARRLGLARNTLEKWLERHDRECLARLMARDPKDHNRTVSEVSISDLSGRTERSRRKKNREGVAA